MAHARSIRAAEVDRHADPSVLPRELRAARRRVAEPDPDEGACFACTPERGEGGHLVHERSCPARRAG